MKKIFHFFEELAEQKWSGFIEARASEGLAYICLRKGRFLYAYRPLDRSIERLEKLSSIELPPLNAISPHEGWIDFIEICLRLNADQTQRLMRYFEIDRFEVFFRIFFWTNLELVPQAQEPNESQDSEISYFHPTKIESLLKEAQHRDQEWQSIQRRIESSKRIFVLKSKTSNEQFSTPDIIDLALQFESNEASFSPEEEMERDILKLCNGKNSVEDLIRSSYQGEFLVLRQLIELWDRGLIEPLDKRTRSANASLRPTKYLRDVLIVSSVLIVFGGILNLLAFYNQLHREAFYEIPNELSQTLELYRAEFGQYPTQLRELNETNHFFLQKGQNLPYQWESPTRYRWKAKPIE
ncbi:MAG: hypothetical protein ACO3LE_00220 [Bdellovibrionota bacterium]